MCEITPCVQRHTVRRDGEETIRTMTEGGRFLIATISPPRQTRANSVDPCHQIGPLFNPNVGQLSPNLATF